MKVLIATLKRPISRKHAEEMNTNLRGAAIENEVTITKGIIWSPGPGCANLGFELLGSEEAKERFAGWLTLALMPAKLTKALDDFPEEDEWRFTE